MKNKALLMLSGGLDSVLAGRIMLELGTDLEAIHFVTPFCITTPKGSSLAASKKAAQNLGIKLKTMMLGEEFLEMEKHPKYGYGSHVNPCIDCRILTLKKAKEYMKKIGAGFIVTGEVLGERPMSQHKNALILIDKQTELKGLILRPLSAKCLEPTIPEKEGIVDREKLLDIRGRSRKPQLALAKKYGIKEYLAPAGGCLLTDPGFAERVKDLIEHDELTMKNVEFLKVGRHFRLSKKIKVIIGRDEKENTRLENLAEKNDVLLEMDNIPGPVCVIRGNPKTEEIETAASITAQHTKAKDKKSVTAVCHKKGSTKKSHIEVKPGLKNTKRIDI